MTEDLKYDLILYESLPQKITPLFGSLLKNRVVWLEEIHFYFKHKNDWTKV